MLIYRYSADYSWLPFISALYKTYNDLYLTITKDRSGDTNLIHAAKAGHKSIVEALLKKYADVDLTGKVNSFSFKTNT